MVNNIQLFKGDCLDVMDGLIERNIKVDAVICDPPYGTTSCKWDTIIPFEPLWERLNKLIKDNGTIVLFGSQPFTSKLIVSNIKNFKEELVWGKDIPSNFVQAKKRHMKYHENIIVFCKKGVYTYNRQMIKRESRRVEQMKKNGNLRWSNNREVNEVSLTTKYEPKSFDGYNVDLKNPSTILRFNKVNSRAKDKTIHPTQKPVELMEYLVKTYTNENETVLDFAMGSGSTGVACLNVNRKFIGIEIDDNYFEIAKKRIEEHGNG
jgi:site-specific DNA-methyltransferase (adenine-specific)